MARLRVQHCILSQTTRQYGANPTSDLLGVDYFHTIPADTEFPGRIPQIELFVRFFGYRESRGKVRISVWVLDVDGSERQNVFQMVYPLTGRAMPGWEILDRSFKLRGIDVPKLGTYSIAVEYRKRSSRWSPRSWRRLATEFFYVERAT